MANNNIEQGKKPAASTLVLAFLLLSVTLTASVWLVVHSAREVSRVTQTEALVTKQRKATDQLYRQLLNTSTQAEIATLQYADDVELKRYLVASAKTDTALSALRKMVANHTQLQRIDSLQNLLWMRRDGTVRLVSTLRTENHIGGNLQQQIKALHKSHRPVTMQVEVPVVERGEQLVIERRKRGFFRRLGDAFRRAKDDTIHSQVVQHKAAYDTAQTQVNIADTLAHLLTNVHRDMQRDSLLHTRKLYLNSDQLRAASLVLSQHMAKLIENFTTAQLQLISKTISQERRQRQIAAVKLATMAVLSIVLSGLLIVWLVRDIQRSNRYRRALELAKEQSEQLMAQREQLLLTISHDIKAPVNTILGYLRLLPHSLIVQHTELKAIEASSQHLLQLVVALLDYHKLEVGKEVVHNAPTHINKVLQNVSDAFLPIAQQKGVALSTNLCLPTALWADADALRLQQIVENLMSNAVKYTAHGQITLSAKWDAQTAQLNLSVTDTGCGMTQYDLDRIFNPFTRVKGSEGHEGSGLGLSITHKLVELLGGTLVAHSKLGHGSSFVLTLPLKVCKPAQQEPLPTSNEGEVQQLLPSTICCAVIDDDVLQLQLTEAMLCNVLSEDSVVKTFTKTDELLQWLDNGNCPTLLLTDIEMPGMSGYEVLKAVHQHQPCESTTYVVAMTSHLLVPINDFKQRGFNDVLFKPFNQNDLLRMLQGIQSGEQTALEDKNIAIKQACPCSLSALTAFADGDEQAEQAILKQFASDCQQHLQLLEQALVEQNKAEACRIAHKMLPTFTLIGSQVLPALQTLEAHRTDNTWSGEDEQLCQQVVAELKLMAKQNIFKH